MVLDRIAQVVLIVFGALLLALLVLGLAISCRPIGADPAATATALAASATPSGGTLVFPSPTLLPPFSPAPSATSITTGPATATPTPTNAPGPTAVPSATAVPGATGVPGATAVPNPTTATGGGTVYVPGATVRHVVSRGEWLLQIARCYGIAYSALQAANPMAFPDYILPGATLTVPNIGSQGAIVGAPCVVSYTVAAGDTWESLAQRQATTVAILQRANPGPLSVGRAIWVPRVP